MPFKKTHPPLDVAVNHWKIDSPVNNVQHACILF